MLESAIVAVLGLVFAFAANAISPRGLVLARNYFPGATKASSLAGATAGRPAGERGHAGATGTALEALAARLKTSGLELINSNQVTGLFRDPRYEQELVVFIDARADRDYSEGHIPGAYQLDHYHPEKYLPLALSGCQTADKVVVYCNGGACEDSEFTALLLSEAGVPNDRLLIYGGGMQEWAANGLPVEIGQRKSGNLRRKAK